MRRLSLLVTPLLPTLFGMASAQHQGSGADVDSSFSDPPPSCDVLIAGGSTAALSAALTAAAADVKRRVQVCLTEPTDELGGQLAFNPAIDYGYAPRSPSAEWASLVALVTPKGKSPCWVSKSCYPPSRLRSWIRWAPAFLTRATWLDCRYTLFICLGENP
jgi:hypothetical protein